MINDLMQISLIIFYFNIDRAVPFNRSLQPALQRILAKSSPGLDI